MHGRFEIGQLDKLPDRSRRNDLSPRQTGNLLEQRNIGSRVLHFDANGVDSTMTVVATGFVEPLPCQKLQNVGPRCYSETDTLFAG